MQFSLRVLLFAVGCFCMSLALTQMTFPLSCVFLVAMVALLGFLVQRRTWRCIAYGAIAGICGGILLMQVVMACKLGRISDSCYQESFESIAIIEVWRPYVVHIGAFLGAAAAVMCFSKHQSVQKLLE